MNADRAVESAVRRLGDAGVDRFEALERINKTLSKALGELSAVCLGNTSILRNMALAATVKLDEYGAYHFPEEEVRNGV